MKSLIENKARQFYEMIFSQPEELTQEEKQEVIDDFNGSDEGKKINARIKMINTTFGVLQSAIAGVSFQYYRDFYDSKSDNAQNTSDLFFHSRDFIEQNSDTMIGLSICFVAGASLELAKRLVISQVNSRPHIISQDIKQKISSLTPQQLMDGIRNIEEGNEAALNIKMPRTVPFVRGAAKNIIGLSSIYMSSLSADQQLLTFLASLSVANFTINQFEKRIYQNTSLHGVAETFDNALLNAIFAAVPFLREDVREAQEAPSILGKKLDSELSSEEKQQFSSSIKKEMEKMLVDRSFKKEVGKFFLDMAELSTFIAPIITNPGSQMVEDDHFASALDFVIGSISSNVFKSIRDNVSSHFNNKIAPATVEEIDGIDAILEENIEVIGNQDDEILQKEAMENHIEEGAVSPSTKLSPRENAAASASLSNVGRS